MTDATEDDLPALATLMASSPLLQRYGTTRDGALESLLEAVRHGDMLLVSRSRGGVPEGDVRRVVIEAHYISDVIAAGFVGAFGAILVRNWFAARRLAFVPGTDGAVHALPAPSWRRVKAVARRLIGQ